MRTSRLSRDTAKVFKRPSESISPPRRTTRSSLSRFAHATASSPTPISPKKEILADIEDVIEPPFKRRRKVTTRTTPQSIKSELVEEVTTKLSSSATADRSPRVRKPARKTGVDAATGEDVIAPPSEWQDVYDVVKKMRSPGGPAYPAAVDTMGCERLADTKASARDQRFHTLVSLMLSSQTKDTVNAIAMGRLKTEMPGWKAGVKKGLTLENMLAVDDKFLNEMIWQVGFHNNKTK